MLIADVVPDAVHRMAPRDGSALLQGIVYCGESGHKLSVIYRPRPCYRCVELRRRYGGPICQHIPADPVDARVVAAFFAALAPAELELYEQAMAEQRASAERVTRTRAASGALALRSGPG